MSNLERKFGKYAIPNLTMVLLGCYVVGYVIQLAAPQLFAYLTLNPYEIFHGQVWRMITWVLVPPTAMNSTIDLLFVLIMLLFYYSLGTTLERTWGTWNYNVYIFRGIGITVLASILVAGLYLLIFKNVPESFFATGALQYSTYYINMSIFLAYALTYSNAQVLLMFVIPVKVKWLGIIYTVMLVFEMLEALVHHKWFCVAAIGASLLNFLIYFLQKNRHLKPQQIHRKAQFKREIRNNPNPGITKHKCAVCGRTEESNPELEFRFCSKCNGNYEYCQDHLFTHQHVK